MPRKDTFLMWLRREVNQVGAANERLRTGLIEGKSITELLDAYGIKLYYAARNAARVRKQILELSELERDIAGLPSSYRR